MPDLSWVDWPATFQSIGAVGSLLANVGLLIVAGQSTRTARAAVEAARTSAEVARRQIEVTAAIEAPAVRVVNVRIGGMNPTRQDGRPQIPDIPFLIVDLVNRGRSPATVTAFGFAHVVRNGPPPEVREADPLVVMTDIFLLARDSYEFRQMFELDGEERRHIMIAHEHLWIWGFVDFVDGLGTERRQRFFVRADVDANLPDTLFRFRPLRPPPLIA